MGKKTFCRQIKLVGLRLNRSGFWSKPLLIVVGLLAIALTCISIRCKDLSIYNSNLQNRIDNLIDQKSAIITNYDNAIYFNADAETIKRIYNDSRYFVITCESRISEMLNDSEDYYIKENE